MANFPNGLSQLDMQQVIRKQAVVLPDGSIAQQVSVLTGSLVPEQYDEIDLTYIVAGPGAGEIGTVIYKLNGSAIATLTLSYDGSNRLIQVLRS